MRVVEAILQEAMERLRSKEIETMRRDTSFKMFGGQGEKGDKWWGGGV